MDWRQNLIEDSNQVRAVLANVKSIAVLGIKTERQAGEPAYYVADYMHKAGFQIIPVPVYYPEVEQILGEKVYRKVADIPGQVDMVNVFRRSQDVLPHVEDILAKQPKIVWLQLGIRNDEAAARMAKAGIQVIQDRCLMVEHMRARR